MPSTLIMGNNTIEDFAADLSALNESQVQRGYFSNEGLLSKINVRRKEITNEIHMHPSSKAAVIRELDRFEKWINQ